MYSFQERAPGAQSGCRQYTEVPQRWSKPTHAEVASHRCTLRIAADHPALPGHFPGRPIVPGVVLLDCVLTAAEQWLGRALAARSLRQAKFNSMLLPDEVAELELQWADQELRFAITRTDASSAQVIAQGAFTVIAASDAPAGKAE
jgi:3-hydroxymyristoyl/3-hydroxydecanoyl-(acyl carrier protein) dehydratase